MTLTEGLVQVLFDALVRTAATHLLHALHTHCFEGLALLHGIDLPDRDVHVVVLGLVRAQQGQNLVVLVGENQIALQYSVSTRVTAAQRSTHRSVELHDQVALHIARTECEHHHAVHAQLTHLFQSLRADVLAQLPAR